MSEFSSIANVDAVVTDDSLRQARRDIEQGIGDVEVGVRAGGGGRQPRDPRSGQFMSMRGVEQRVVDLASINEDLHDLAEERNELLDELVDGGLGAGGGGGGLGITGGLAAGGIGGSTVGGLGATVLGGLAIPALAALGTGQFVKDAFGGEVTEDSGPSPATRRFVLTDVPDIDFTASGTFNRDRPPQGLPGGGPNQFLGFDKDNQFGVSQAEINRTVENTVNFQVSTDVNVEAGVDSEGLEREVNRRLADFERGIREWVRQQFSDSPSAGATTSPGGAGGPNQFIPGG